jgi:transcriptional regulator with XRE-family HTH domain
VSELGERVKAYRAEHKLSRRAFADATGLTQTKVYNIENGRAATQDELTRITAYLGIGPSAVDTSAPPKPAERPAAVPASAPAHPAPPVVVELPPELPPPVEEVSAVSPPNTAQELDTQRAVVELDPSLRYVSNSEVQAFKRCKRKWWLGWHRRLRPGAFEGVDLSSARASGSRVHRALAAYYVPEGEQREDPREALERALVEDWTAFVNSRHEAGVYEDSLDVTDFKKAAELERAMVEGYTEWLAETGADADYRVIAPESFVQTRLEDLPDNVRIAGQLDVRLYRDRDGVQLFMDHKTVGDFTRPTRTLQLDEQMLHYHLLERLTASEQPGPSRGALYNMLRRVKRTVRATPPFYKRVEVTHNDHEVRSFTRRLKSTIRDILHAEAKLTDGVPHQVAVYPTPTQDCAWQCPFFQVCNMLDDGSRAEDALRELYTVGEPLDYYQSLMKTKTGGDE